MSQPNNNDDHNNKYKKIFVGGLAWIVTTDALRSFFQERYGEVVEANVVSETLLDGNLKSKGYGFVTFRDAESANRACQPPHPTIEGRQTNINLAYLRAKNNSNHSNQTGLLQEAGPSHQYQHGPFNQMAWHPYQNGPFNQAWNQYHNGWCSQVGWHQYPQFYTKPHFPQVYWDSSHYGAYHHMYDAPRYPCSSTVNCHQTNSVRPPGMSQPPTRPRFVELHDTNQETVSTADGVLRNDNNEEVDTETDASGVDQQNGKDQEGEISGQENGVKQDVKDQEGEINGQDNGIKQDVKVLKDENSPQEKGLDHEEKTHHMEVGLTTKKKERFDKNAYE
ncbi:hypothetical protein N665_1035s0014 [Sinapis alba]|nr:hypothetical protein N665_1035s0014 [Sinapis alba]